LLRDDECHHAKTEKIVYSEIDPPGGEGGHGALRRLRADS